MGGVARVLEKASPFPPETCLIAPENPTFPERGGKGYRLQACPHQLLVLRGCSTLMLLGLGCPLCCWTGHGAQRRTPSSSVM